VTQGAAAISEDIDAASGGAPDDKNRPQMAFGDLISGSLWKNQHPVNENAGKIIIDIILEQQRCRGYPQLSLF